MQEQGQVAQGSAYGFSEHTPKESSFVFGLNSGNVFLTKFKHTMNGGKDGADMEALDIVFTVDGKERNYKRFPVTKAFTKDDQGNDIEVTDPNHPAILAERQMLSATIIHIVGCFVEKQEIQSALSVPIGSYKQFCDILAGLLPANVSEIPLDIFGQYQWTIKGENSVTYVEFPKNMKHGRWISKHVAPVGKWEKQQKPNADSGETALRYVDADSNVHPFQRNGWYMDSNFAHQQKEAPSAGAQAMGAASTGSSDDW